jgi:hypothetical protein
MPGTGAPVHAQLERRAHFLRARAEVERPAQELDPLARALVERVVGAHGVRVLRAEPRQAEALAHLLVGDRREDEIAGRLEPLARERRQRDRAGRDLALHVERAAAPDLVVAQLAGPRVDLPLGSIGNHRVGVREQHQAGPVTASRQASDQVRALRDARVELALDTALREVVAQELGRGRLVTGRVDRVEPDQLLQQLARFVAQVGRLRQRRVPSTKRYSRVWAMPPLSG